MPTTEDQGIYYPTEDDLARFWEQMQTTAETSDAALTAILASVFADGVLPIIQWGAVTIPVANDDQGDLTVTFPRPYGAPPMVFATTRGNFNWFAGCRSTTATQTTLRVVYREFTSANGNPVVMWTTVGF